MAMKLKYNGGNTDTIRDPATGEKVSVKASKLEQLFEDTLYVWPEVGMVLSVDDAVGAWLLYKCSGFLEQMPTDPATQSAAAPRVQVAMREAPAPAKPAAGKPAPAP